MQRRISATETAVSDRASCNLTEAVLVRARERGRAPCVLSVRSDALDTLTWSELAARVQALMLGLDELALSQRARIGVLSHNRVEWIVCDLAIAGRGYSTISLDPGWSDLMVVRILNHSRAETVIVETSEQALHFERLRERLPHVRTIVVIDHALGPKTSARPLAQLIEAGHSAFDEARIAALLAGVSSEDLATVIFTGGSTGEPKGVMRTHGNALSKGWAWFPWMGDEQHPDPEPDDVLLDPLSFCHSAGRWWYQMALVRGATLGLPASSTLSLRDLELLAPTHLATVPRVVIGLQKELPRDADEQTIRARLGGRLRSVVFGGAPLAAGPIEFFESAGVRVRAGYGGTEAGIVSVQSTEVRRGTVGKPIGAEVRLEDGEILVRGPAVTPGYLENEAATSRAGSDDGWWRTGDAGRFDDAGHLVIAGRVHAMFNCNEGTNIDPVELEGLLESDPWVRQAILLGHGRPFLSALLVPDQSMIERDGPGEPSALLMSRIERINETLQEFEKIRRIELVDAARTQAVRVVTAAQKTRIDRDAVDRVFEAEIRAIYG